MNYYSIPLRVDEIVKGKQKHEEKEIRESIHQNIRLILKSFSLSYRFDPIFGCVMNKYHASTPPQKKTERIWRENIRESIQKNLKDMLQRYERRINVIDVVIEMKPARKEDNTPVVNVGVQVVGQLTLGRKDKFNFPDSEIADSAQEIFPLMIPFGKK